MLKKCKKFKRDYLKLTVHFKNFDLIKMKLINNDKVIIVTNKSRFINIELGTDIGVNINGNTFIIMCISAQWIKYMPNVFFPI